MTQQSSSSQYPKGGDDRASAGSQVSIARTSVQALGEGRAPGYGVANATVWLVFLIPQTINAFTQQRYLPGMILVAFIVCYVSSWITWPGYGSDSHPVAHPDSRAVPRVLASRQFRIRLDRLVVALTVASAVVATVLQGQLGTTTWVYTAIVVMWRLPNRAAVAVATVVVVLHEVLTRTLPGWDPPDAMVSVSVVVCLGMVLAWRSNRERRLEQARSRAQQHRLEVLNERNRMARDVHDILGHSLTVITVKAELVGRLLEVGSPAAATKARAEVADVERLAREALGDVRRTVEGYREVSLSGELATAREALRAAGIDSDLPVSVDEVEPGLRELFAWGVREGVTNVIRHSGARQVQIRLEPARLEVSDDGQGSPPSGRPGQDGQPRKPGENGGNGLSGLTQRAATYGATVTVNRSDLGGFTLVVEG